MVVAMPSHNHPRDAVLCPCLIPPCSWCMQHMFLCPVFFYHLLLPSCPAACCPPPLPPMLQDGRVVFMLPFQGAVIAGTTDEPCPLTDRPRAHAEEVAFILSAISDFLNIKVGCVGQRVYIPDAEGQGSKEVGGGGRTGCEKWGRQKLLCRGAWKRPYTKGLLECPAHIVRVYNW